MQRLERRQVLVGLLSMVALVTLPATLGAGAVWQAVPVSLDPLVVIGVLIAFGGTVWGLLVTGIIRIGKIVDDQEKKRAEDTAKLEAAHTQQVADLRGYYDQRIADLVAQYTARLATSEATCKRWEDQATGLLGDYDNLQDSVVALHEALKQMAEQGVAGRTRAPTNRGQGA